MASLLIVATKIDENGSYSTLLYDGDTSEGPGSHNMSSGNYLTWDLGAAYHFDNQTPGAAAYFFDGSGQSGDYISVLGSNNSDMSGAVELCQIPVEGSGTSSSNTIGSTTSYRYVKFLYTGGYYGNFTELEIYGASGGAGRTPGRMIAAFLRGM